MVILESFKADKYPRECKTFIEEHTRVLRVFDLANITSAKSDWAFSPSTIIITVRDKITGEMIAGGRIQVADGILNLPIEDAVCDMDKRIYDIINNDRSNSGTAEICGLWSTRKAAKLGIGSLFIMRSLVAVCSQLDIKSMYSLCAPTTVSSAKKIGSRIIEEIGNNGTFYYPKLDLVATAMKVPNILTLDYADIDQKDIIFDLRNNLECEKIVSLREETHIKYALQIKGIKPPET